MQHAARQCFFLACLLYIEYFSPFNDSAAVLAGYQVYLLHVGAACTPAVISVTPPVPSLLLSSEKTLKFDCKLFPII